MDKNEFSNYYQEPSRQAVDEQEISVYLAKVMGWMFLGLLTTVTLAFVTLTFEPLQNLVFGNSIGYIGIIILQLALVVYFSFALNKMNASTATVLFLLYSALTGITLSTLVIIYQMASIISTFALTAVIFLLMSIYGYVTKKDLTKMGNLAMFGLLGIILVSLFNMLIFKSQGLDIVVSIIGVIIFIGLIAYDTQKVKAFYINAKAQGHDDESQIVKKIAIFGAFALYLDFINIFLRLLRLFGKRRD